ncbi:BLUF domain-containing protein [Paracoccus luteus]|uniref:BLUF domain-containing protein n=1 Tax=Paracoccus luteus TaxID=2508543 RepID=UPI00106F576F|nr:BLUF domain-containing protein [Paracoccus luteus]
MTELAHFLYRSESEMPPNSDAARDLMAQAARINGELHLTGFLHHEDGFFFQWLEGPLEPLDLIAGRLMRDPRHYGVTTLSRDQQAERRFNGWDMGYSTRADRSILAWLADHGVAPWDRRAYAAGVLSFLRERSGQPEG